MVYDIYGSISSLFEAALSQLIDYEFPANHQKVSDSTQMALKKIRERVTNWHTYPALTQSF